MKKILFLFVFLFGVLCSAYCQKPKNDDSYVLAMKAIKTNNLALLLSSLKQIKNIDYLIPMREDLSYSLLGYAIHCRNKSMTQKLLDLNVDICSVMADDIFEYDALYMAIDNNDLSLVNQMLARGLNPNQPYGEDGECPLVEACQVNSVPIAATLLKHGAKVNGIGRMGNGNVAYPLMTAIDSENVQMVQLLLQYGARKDVKDNAGFTPLSLARQKKATHIIRLLETANTNK